MRLIDADKLEDAIIRDELPTSLYWLNEDNLNIIDSQDEVEAIPIEWLKNKSKDLADAYWNNVRNKLVLNMNELPLVIDEIVRIWEKENETESK